MALSVAWLDTRNIEPTPKRGSAFVMTSSDLQIFRNPSYFSFSEKETWALFHNTYVMCYIACLFFFHQVNRGGQSVFCIGGGGGEGASKQAPETLTCRGFWGNSPSENFEILKLRNATFSILK